MHHSSCLSYLEQITSFSHPSLLLLLPPHPPHLTLFGSGMKGLWDTCYWGRHPLGV